MGRDVPFDEDDICDGCGARGAYDFMGDCYCQKCVDRHSSEGGHWSALATWMDTNCQEISGDDLLKEYRIYCMVAGDDFSLHPNDEIDDAWGAAVDREVRRRMGLPIQSSEARMRGARCKYGAEGLKAFSNSPNLKRLGTIVGESRDKTCWRVHWDGRKPGGDAIHKSYLTVLE